MREVTFYIHGQGIPPELANSHAEWIRNLTGLSMTPLYYHDIVDEVEMDILGVPMRLTGPPLGDAETRKTNAAYVAELIHGSAHLGPDADTPAWLPDTTEARLGEVRSILFETYRSSLRYLADPDIHNAVRRSMQDQVDAAISALSLAAGERVAVTMVGHSLGSVIALDLLHAPHPSVDYATFISLGSPLGLIGSAPGPFSERLLPSPLRRLEIAWHDIASEGDQLAAVQRIARRRGFQGRPLSVTTVAGEFEYPHEAYFHSEELARYWTRFAAPTGS